MEEMTESAAWIFLASLWDVAEPYNLRKPTPHILPIRNDDKAYPCFGLCQSINRLGHYRRVSEATYQKMHKRLEAFLAKQGWRKGNYGYFWPLTTEGQKLRASQCIKFAEESK